VPRFDELGQVRIQGVVGDPCQGYPISVAVFLSGGQGDVQYLGGDRRILFEGLVKVAHPE